MHITLSRGLKLEENTWRHFKNVMLNVKHKAHLITLFYVNSKITQKYYEYIYK